MEFACLQVKEAGRGGDEVKNLMEVESAPVVGSRPGWHTLRRTTRDKTCLQVASEEEAREGRTSVQLPGSECLEEEKGQESSGPARR